MACWGGHGLLNDYCTSFSNIHKTILHGKDIKRTNLLMQLEMWSWAEVDWLGPSGASEVFGLTTQSSHFLHYPRKAESLVTSRAGRQSHISAFGRPSYIPQPHNATSSPCDTYFSIIHFKSLYPESVYPSFTDGDSSLLSHWIKMSNGQWSGSRCLVNNSSPAQSLLGNPKHSSRFLWTFDNRTECLSTRKRCHWYSPHLP